MAGENSTESAGAARAGRRPLVLAGVLVAVVVALVGSLRLLGGALFTGDGSRSPEGLFEDLRTLGASGDWHATWTRVHPDEQAEFRRAIDESRVFLRRNPGAHELGTKQFRCSYDEFQTLPYRELYARASLGMEGELAEARMVRQEDAPDVPGDVLVHWIGSYGDDRTMRARRSGDGLWYVIKMNQ